MNDTSHPDPFEMAERGLTPKSWIWDEDGDLLTGRYIKSDQGIAKDGRAVAIAVIQTRDGTTRSLWLFDDDEPQEWHLPEKWKAADPRAGDYVSIRRNPLKLSQNGMKVRYYDVSVFRTSDVDDSPPAGDETTEGALEAERDERDAAVGF